MKQIKPVLIYKLTKVFCVSKLWSLSNPTLSKNVNMNEKPGNKHNECRVQ